MELNYPGKMDRLTLLRQTPTADFAEESSYGARGSGWRNRLYYGDNLPVLKALYEDPAIRGHIRLVYIDPPMRRAGAFATVSTWTSTPTTTPSRATATSNSSGAG